jgi:hypothetical protein
VGLYLCVFASPTRDDELEGVEVGSYDDFHALRTAVADRLEGGQWGSRFPVLMAHADSDGEWSAQDARALAVELRVIEEELAALPAIGFVEGSWQASVSRGAGLIPVSLAECFIDVDGEPLFARLRALTDVAHTSGCPISFQ